MADLRPRPAPLEPAAYVRRVLLIAASASLGAGCGDLSKDHATDLVLRVEDSLAGFEVDSASIDRNANGIISIVAHLDRTGYRRILLVEAGPGGLRSESVYLEAGLPRVLGSAGRQIALAGDAFAGAFAGPHGRGAALVRLADELLERGGEGTAWIIYGYAHLDDGDSTFVRVEIDWDRPEARLADFGRTMVRFEGVAVAPDTSRIEFTWPDRTSGDCALRRTGESEWVGTCVGTAGEREILLGGDYSPDLGEDLTPSEVDLAILDRAAALLADSLAWNRADERSCTDDRAAGAWSFFCALYQASIDVDGRYLHRRPAMAAAREAIWEAAPERVFAHQLRDFNNSLLTSHDDVVGVLSGARAALADSIGG